MEVNLPPDLATANHDAPISQLDPIVQEWLNSFNDHNFSTTDLRKFWSTNVPDLFNYPLSENSLTHKFNQAQIDQILFDRLEQFITASPNPANELNHLKNNGQHQVLCGRVFKSNEPCYVCRDCSIDSTCVRCVNCFKNSSHKNHRYKVQISQGNGICDCGDAEAWKSDPYCENHKPQNRDCMPSLDEGLRQRFETVVITIVNYCFEMLCWENNFDLPKDLESEEASKYNYHATVLFNDEVHTFDQVISSLTRAILCQKSVAKDFASYVDRAGRSIIKVTEFEECKRVKAVVEKTTSRSNLSRPLKCEVIQMSVIAHQEHAMQLLDWLNRIIPFHEDFRTAFGKIMQSNVFTIVNDQIVYQKVNILESIMINDVHLWKTARTLWHKLFINGMLMNYESKIFFAKVFTKLYDQLIQDYINDDNDETLSIVNLSLQIYSTTSLAHDIIEEEDALHLISKSFYKECDRHKENGKLIVKRNQTSSFKRSQTVLNDLKYILQTPPSNWTEKLRKSFLHGFETIIVILKLMQDMDSIIRQVGQHLEMESEWESGIHLQSKMSIIVTQLFEWCSSDFKVLRRAVKIALDNLYEKFESSNIKVKTCKLSDISCKCIDYDVSSLPVTIHLPLSRALADLLLELSTHDVQFLSLESRLDLVDLMELPLRTLVMVCQFRAGMWRRNGFWLVNQINLYHGVLLREEMYDKDIVMMQYVGSQIDSNEFLIHLLNKFDLMFWIQDNFEKKQRKQEEDFIRQTSTLVEEFLNLLLIIVSERHTLGVGKVTIGDKIKKEIIQCLCVEPVTHSDLIKNLPKSSKVTSIESLINEVAIFKKLIDDQSGKYDLKEQYYKDFNPFYYHYSRVVQCLAEDSQLKRKKHNKEQFIVCTPPIPPELSDQFKPLRNILVSKVFLHIVKVILERVCDESIKSFSENQYEKTLHLIGVALHEEKRDLANEQIEKKDKFSFTEVANEINFIELLKQCELCPRVESHKSLTNWLLQNFKETVEKRSGKSTENNDQSNSTTASEQSAACKRNSTAAVLRQKIMEQMSAMQNKFIKDNSEYFQNEKNEASENKMCTDEQSEQPTDVDIDPIAIGNEQRGNFTEFETFFCMLCRENENLANSNSCLVLAAFAQKSTVLSKNRNRKVPVNHRKANQNQEQHEQLAMPSDLHCGTHVSTCGHVMHLECWTEFFDSVVKKERRRPIRYGRHGSFNVEKHEYLCPLCECLSNTVIPVVANSFYRDRLRKTKNNNLKISMNDWFSVVYDLVSNAKYTCENYGSITKRKVKLDSLNDETKQSFRTLQELYSENADKEKNFDPRLVSSIRKLSKSIRLVETGHELDDLDTRASLFTYWSCSFTIQSLEKVLREEQKPVFGNLSSRKHSCLQVLVRYCSVNSVIYDFNSIRNHCIDLMHYLLKNEKYILNPSSILDVDAFSILISLILTSGSLFVKDDKEEVDIFKTRTCLTLPLGNVVDQYLVQLMVLFHIVQIILTQNELYEQMPMELNETASTSTAKEVSNSENRKIAAFYVDILKIAGIKSVSLNSDNMNNNLADSIATMLKSKLLPFLRCAALFYHYLTEIKPPKKLYDSIHNDGTSIQDIEEKEFLILCEYLALPKKLSELFTDVSLVRLAQQWVRHPRIQLIFEEHERSNSSSKTLSASAVAVSNSPSSNSIEQHENVKLLPLKLIKQPHKTNRLIELPEDYTELINNVASMPCASSNCYEGRSPTLCLVCGTMMFSDCYAFLRELDGENYGSCCYHAMECGAGVGIFLRTNDCRILLLAGKSKGCFLPAPFVDEYGETDVGLIRGNALHLSKTSYNLFSLLWLRHGIPERVARIMETSSFMNATDWNML